MYPLAKPSIAEVTAKDNRLFIEAVLWIARTGSPGRDLDPALNHWHTTSFPRSTSCAQHLVGIIANRT